MTGPRRLALALAVPLAVGCSTPKRQEVDGASPRSPIAGMPAAEQYTQTPAAAEATEPAQPAEPVPPAEPTRPAESVEPAEPTHPASATSDAPDDCDALRARFDARLADAKGRCTQVADCGCFSQLPFDNRLGVSDRHSATDLQALAEDYHQKRCPLVSVQIARPPVCAPRCADGRCVP